jgi:hypothetical protein
MSFLLQFPYEMKILFAVTAILCSGFLAAAMTMTGIMHQKLDKFLYDVAGFIGFNFASVAWILLTYDNPPVILCEIFLYLPLIALPLGIYYTFKEKDYRFVVDTVGFVVLLPALQLHSSGVFLYGFGLLCALLRSVSAFTHDIASIGHSINRFTVKSTLDTFEREMLVSDRSGRIVYINNAMILLLNRYGIPTHSRVEPIILDLKSHAFKIASEHSFLLFDEGNYLLIEEEDIKKGKQLSAHLVTEEVNLNETIQKTNLALQEEQKNLRASLDGIKGVAHNQEKQRLRSLVHDSFAEEVSFVHQILQNPKTNDMRPLKTLVKRGLGNYEDSYEDLTEMIDFYRLLGIHFTLEGDFNLCPHKKDGLEFLRETIDNAIRHGNATQITITSKVEGNFFFLITSNNGAIPEKYVEHNGLLHLKAMTANRGGSIEVRTDKEFTIIAKIPRF